MTIGNDKECHNGLIGEFIQRKECEEREKY